MRLVFAVLLFLAFTGYSVGVLVVEGPLAFLELTPRGWAVQLFTDLVIACGFGFAWLVPDAKKRGLNPWPYVAATFALGSIATLAYLVRREVHDARTGMRGGAAA